LCGATNRVPIARLDERARCGHCKSSLANGAVGALSAARLERVVATCDLPLVVQIASDRVPQERRRDEALIHVASALKSAALFCRVDGDREPAVLVALGVSALPSLALAMAGRVVSRLSGTLEAERLHAWIAQHAFDALHV
jgi:thioredoxin 2